MSIWSTLGVQSLIMYAKGSLQYRKLSIKLSCIYLKLESMFKRSTLTIVPSTTQCIYLLHAVQVRCSKKNLDGFRWINKLILEVHVSALYIKAFVFTTSCPSLALHYKAELCCSGVQHQISNQSQPLPDSVRMFTFLFKTIICIIKYFCSKHFFSFLINARKLNWNWRGVRTLALKKRDRQEDGQHLKRPQWTLYFSCIT